MTKRRPSGLPDYAVGRGRPPKATQFAPGTSGNPRGRPKGSRTVGAVLNEILQQKLTVAENGKTRKVAALEVMLRRLVNDAVRSDAKAIKLLLSMVDRYGETPDTKLRLDELLAEDRDILARFALPSESADDAALAAAEAIPTDARAKAEGLNGG